MTEEAVEWGPDEVSSDDRARMAGFQAVCETAATRALAIQAAATPAPTAIIASTLNIGDVPTSPRSHPTARITRAQDRRQKATSSLPHGSRRIMTGSRRLPTAAIGTWPIC
jgi:hypothetical protein